MTNFDSKLYWEKRYNTRQNSGAGSYGEECRWKADYVNKIINQYQIQSINDYGHGDCNQLKYINGFSSYYGYDVSKTIRSKCREQFSNSKYKFIDDVADLPFSDLSISLDVVYHLIEDEYYEDYLGNLFSNSNYVIIYSTDFYKQESSHVTHRNFSTYVDENFKNHKLIDKDFTFRNDCGMFLYELIKK